MSTTKKTDKNQRQKQATVRIVMMIAILICVNVLASYFHKGLDLTHEKRFTLSHSTKKLLNNMKEVAVIEVYLKGNFPSGLQQLQEAVRERLRSFKEIAGNKIIFRFVNPLEGKSEKEQKQIAENLRQKGIKVLQLNTQNDEEYSMKVFIPYALVQYNSNEMPVYLLEDPPGKAPEERISYAEGKLEYKFASALNVMSKPDDPHLAYIVGNGEDLGIGTLDMLTTLSRHYHLDTLDLAHSIDIPLVYDAIIINQPTVPFTEPEKLRIDQFVMHGGHILWVINALNANMDSLEKAPQLIAMDYGLGLDEILFKYGVRVNNDLVEDMQCMKVRRIVGGQRDLHDWVYFPRLNPTADHPIVRNMDFIMGGFTNSIDTLRVPGINKTVLLQSSKYSRKAASPVRVSLSMMNYPLKNEMFNKPYQPVAVLLEGKFHSAYQRRLAPEYLRYLDSMHQTYKQVCDSDNSMIVISAGNIFTNGYTVQDGPLLLGYYPLTKEFFTNKDFLLNCMEYLTDRSGVLESRSKEVKLRLLDLGRAKDEKATWQVVNVGIPIAAVLVFASCYIFFRKRRYEVRQNTIKNPSKNA